jgi:uncharacterized protein
MRSRTTCEGDRLEVFHGLRVDGREHTLRVIASPRLQDDPAGSTAEFFKEHSWGYGTSRGGELVTYEVRHPVWQTYPARAYELDWDWAAIYGPEWTFLGDQEPVSVVLAEGSPVAVSPC